MATTYGVGIVKPNNLNAQGVDGGLQRTAWANGVDHESLQYEVFFNAETLTRTIDAGKKETLPNDKLFLDVTPSTKEGKASRSVVLEFLRALNQGGRFGNAQRLLGFEEQLRLKYERFYANDWKHAVSSENYGIDFREVSANEIYNTIKPQLARWWGETKGLMCREALVYRRASNLTVAPLSLAQPLNPNQYVMGVASSSQPAYDATLGVFENQIASALTGCTAANCHLSVARVLDMSDYVVENYIETIQYMGYNLHVLLVHPDEFSRMHKPSISDSWAEYWVEAASITDLNKVIPGASMVIGDSVVIVRDRRAPTLTLSGTSSDYTLSYGFMKQGRTTTRTTSRTANVNFNVNFLLGPNCLAKYEPEKPHFEKQLDEYTQYEGIGYIGGCGYQIPVWDVDTPTDSSAQQESSMIVYTQR